MYLYVYIHTYMSDSRIKGVEDLSIYAYLCIDIYICVYGCIYTYISDTPM